MPHLRDSTRQDFVVSLTGYPTPPEGPQEDRSLVKRLADICRADPARFAELVRANDALERERGMDTRAAWAITLADEPS